MEIKAGKALAHMLNNSWFKQAARQDPVIHLWNKNKVKPEKVCKTSCPSAGARGGRRHGCTS